MNDIASTRYCPADLLQKLDNDIHPWLLSEREGGNRTTLSYVKVDILTDTLNRLFGPLGWSVEAQITHKDDFQYEKPGYQNGPAQEMYVFQVVSQVKLTIKAQSDTGSDTIFIQSGIGYGEVKINAHRKDAVGMAVKGAESDGLKRCCNFLGKAFGMFLVGGKQDPVVYAHNGNKNKAVLNRAMRDRDDYERDQRGTSRGRDEGRDQARESEADRRSDSRDERDTGRGSEGGGRGNRDDRGGASTERNRQSRDETAREERKSSGQGDEARGRQSDERQDRQDRSEASSAQREGERRPEEGESSRRRSNARSSDSADKPADKPAGDEEGKGKPAKRKADSNYDLRKVPVTRDNQKDFGATFVRQMEAMRQPEDQDQMLKTYAQRINELDPDIRELVIERLRERNINVSLLD